MRVAALSASLQQLCRACKDRIFVLAVEACDHFLECLLAVTAAGAIAAPLNLRWGTSEVTAALDLCQPVAVLADAAGLEILQGQARLVGMPCIHVGSAPAPTPTRSADQQQHVIYRAEELIQQHMGASLCPLSSSTGAALVCFTSGSTGQPKGALITHTAVHCQSMAKVIQLQYSRQDTYLHCLPLFHVGGLSSMLAMLMVGAVQVSRTHAGVCPSVCSCLRSACAGACWAPHAGRHVAGAQSLQMHKYALVSFQAACMHACMHSLLLFICC